MKKSLAIIPLLALLFLSGCNNSLGVVEYNDTLVEIVKECTDSNQELFNIFQADDSTIDFIEEALENSITICKNAETRASRLGDFEKDDSLKNAVVSLLSSEVDYLKKFGSTSNYRNIENITDADKIAYNSVVNELYAAEESLNDKFVSLQEVQEDFAAKHGLKLK